MVDQDAGYTGTPYWGNDRRCTLAKPDGPPTRALLISAGAIIAVWAGVNVVGGLATPYAGLDTVLLQVLLETGAAALAAIVGLLCFVRWRVVGEASALWAGVGLMLFGVVTITLTGLVPLVYGAANDVAVWLRPASRLVVVAFLAVAVAAPAVDGRLHPWRLVLLAIGATGTLAVTFELMPGFTQHLASAGDAGTGATVSPYGPAVVVGAWILLAAAFLIRGHREGRPLLSWLGLVMVGLGLAELTRIVAAEGSTLWSAGAHLLRLTTLSVGVAGATMELQRAFSQQSNNLLQTVVSAATAEARIRADRQEKEERAHEARNALAAIEGATQTLERHRDQMDAVSRGSLVSALSAEIARMQRLVSADKQAEDRAVFKVAEALAPVITGARAQGTAVLVDVDDDLTAFGRWADTAEVVQNLIENARRYAPGSPVVVRARVEDDRVLVRVEDRGPGVDPEQREAIFRRGVRGKHTNGPAGSGLGLYVSGRLMLEQNGDLWLEDRPGGGAVFVVSLPAQEHQPEESDPVVVEDGAVQGSGAALDEGHEAVEVADGDGLPSDPGHAEGRRLG